jgi:hypothetical protein
MRTSARPLAGQTALLLSTAKIEDEEETGRATATKERKSRCTTFSHSLGQEQPLTCHAALSAKRS